MKNKISDCNKIHSVDFSLMLLISTTALLYSFVTNFSAYAYNAIDMLPFLERKLHPDFLPNDFFTNASVTPNSRHIWGLFILFIAKLLNNNWYNSIFILKLIFVVTCGPLYYKVITLFHEELKLPSPTLFRILVASFTILLVSNPYFIQFFMIAWWHPYLPDASAHNYSILVGLIAVCLYKRVGWFFIFFSGIIHPVLGLAFTFTGIVLHFQSRNNIQILFWILSGILFPCVLHIFLFSTSSNLDQTEFIKIYAFYRHPNHYVPSAFGKMTFTSMQIFIFITLLFTIALRIGYYLKSTIIISLSYICLILPSLIILIHYLFIEKYPLKIVAIVGPSRYLIFVAWVICFLFACIFTTIAKKNTLIQTVSSFIYKIISHHSFSKILVSIVALLIFLIWIKKDVPESKETSALTWLKINTESNAVIACHSKLIDEMDIRYLARRSVFAGECFPFSENHIEEYYVRSSLLFGSFEEINSHYEDIALSRWKFYQKLSPHKVIDISKKRQLDYIIVGNTNPFFKGLTPVFKDKNLSIYYIKEIEGIFDSEKMVQ